MFEFQLKDGSNLMALEAVERENDWEVTGKTMRVVEGPKGGPSLMPWSTTRVIISKGLIGLVAEVDDATPQYRRIRSLLTGVAIANAMPEADPGFKLAE